MWFNPDAVSSIVFVDAIASSIEYVLVDKTRYSMYEESMCVLRCVAGVCRNCSRLTGEVSFNQNAKTGERVCCLKAIGSVHVTQTGKEGDHMKGDELCKLSIGQENQQRVSRSVE